MSKIERGLSAIPDVTLARVNLTDRRVALEWKQGTLDPARFIDRLAELGYKAYPFETAERRSGGGRTIALPAALPRRRGVRDHERDDAVDSGVVRQWQRHDARAARFLSLAVGADRAAGGGLCRPAVLPLGVPRAAHAATSTWTCRSRSASSWRSRMSVVETINHAEHAYFDAAIMLLTFLLVGRYLDQSMRRRTRAVAGNLAALKAETATKFVGADEISQVPVAAIRPGDIVLLRPGERCAVDGTVIEGRSEIDQSLITGETLYVTAEQGTRGLCRLAQHLRHVAGAGLGGVRRHAAGGDHAAARQRAAGALALCAARRPRLAALCAGGACHRAADHARLGADGRELARCHRHRRRRSHHHLSLRARACDPDRADGRLRRDVQGRRAAQFRRCHRAARRGRSRHLRQDRHADAARSRSGERGRHSRRRVSRSPAGLRWRAIIRSPPRWRGRRARNRRCAARSKSPGRACAARVGDVETQAGTAVVLRRRATGRATAPISIPEASIVAFSRGEAKYRVLGAAGAASGRAGR